MEGKIYSPEKGKFISVKTKHGQKVLKNYNEHRLGGDKHQNCAYCKIVNPKTGKMVSTYGQTGGRVIKSYVEQEGGAKEIYYYIESNIKYIIHNKKFGFRKSPKTYIVGSKPISFYLIPLTTKIDFYDFNINKILTKNNKSTSNVLDSLSPKLKECYPYLIWIIDIIDNTNNKSIYNSYNNNNNGNKKKLSKSKFDNYVIKYYYINSFPFEKDIPTSNRLEKDRIKTRLQKLTDFLNNINYIDPYPIHLQESNPFIKQVAEVIQNEITNEAVNKTVNETAENILEDLLSLYIKTFEKVKKEVQNIHTQATAIANNSTSNALTKMQLIKNQKKDAKKIGIEAANIAASAARNRATRKAVSAAASAAENAQYAANESQRKINNLLTLVKEAKLKSKNAAMVSAKAAKNANVAAKVADNAVDNAVDAAKARKSYEKYIKNLKKKNEQDIILGMLKKMDKENKLKIEHINNLLLPRNNKNITEKERENKGNVGLPSNYTELRTWLEAKKDELIRRNAETKQIINEETRNKERLNSIRLKESKFKETNFWNDLIELVKSLNSLDDSNQTKSNWEKPQEIFNKMGISLKELLDFLDRYYEGKKISKNIRDYALWLSDPSEEKLTAARFYKKEEAKKKAEAKKKKVEAMQLKVEAMQLINKALRSNNTSYIISAFAVLNNIKDEIKDTEFEEKLKNLEMKAELAKEKEKAEAKKKAEGITHTSKTNINTLTDSQLYHIISLEKHYKNLGYKFNNIKPIYNKKKEDLIRELEELGELGKLTNQQKSNYGKRIRNLLPFEQYKNNKKIRSLSEFF